MLGISIQGKMRGDYRLHEVGQVLEEPCGPQLGPVLFSHRSRESGSSGKSRALRQDVLPGQFGSQIRGPALEESDYRVNPPRVRLSRFEHGASLVRQRGIIGARFIKDRLNAVATEEAQHHLDAEISLMAWHAARSEETGQVRSGGVGRIQLRQRRNDQEDGHGRHGAGHNTVTIIIAIDDAQGDVSGCD
jgi:hypothetical protein